VREEVALACLAGRRTCRNCGAVYHTPFNPPRQAGVCDACGGELYQRPDETKEAHSHRLQVYQQQTAPLVDYYRFAGRKNENTYFMYPRTNICSGEHG